MAGEPSIIVLIIGYQNDMKIVKLGGTLPFPVRGLNQSHVPMNNFTFP